MVWHPGTALYKVVTAKADAKKCHMMIWAGWYDTWLLIKLMPKGVVVLFSASSLFFCFLSFFLFFSFTFFSFLGFSFLLCSLLFFSFFAFLFFSFLF